MMTASAPGGKRSAGHDGSTLACFDLRELGRDAGADLGDEF